MKRFLNWFSNRFPSEKKLLQNTNEALFEENELLRNACLRYEEMMDDLDSEIHIKDIYVNELRSYIDELTQDSPVKNGPNDWQVAYVPIYKEYPFPPTFDAAQVLANQTCQTGAQAIVKIVFYTGQMDRSL